MQPVKILKFLRQLGVLVQRNLQLIWNDKLLLASLALQSPFMALVIKLTADPNCFTSNLVNIVSSSVTKISMSVSSSRWFCGTWTMATKPIARMTDCRISIRKRTTALLSTTAGRLTPTEASRRMISRSLQISR